MIQNNNYNTTNKMDIRCLYFLMVSLKFHAHGIEITFIYITYIKSANLFHFSNQKLNINNSKLVLYKKCMQNRNKNGKRNF